MPQYTLIGTPFSTYTRSIALGLTYKGITFDQVNVVPHSDVARAHHPFGFLPTLLIRGVEVGEDKVDVKLRESQAIVRYIDRVRPEPTLHIADGAAHAVLAEQMWEFVGFAGAHGFPAVEIGVVKPRLAATDAHQSESDIQTLLAPGVSSLQSFLATIEEHMAPEGYVFGTQLTWADFFLYPLLADLSAVPEGALLSPRLRGWMERMGELEAVRRTKEGTLAAGGRPPLP